jgi:cobalt/nickel transport system permease protein
MRLELDEFAHLDSPLHRWDVRYKLAGLGLLLFACSFVTTLWLLPAMILTTAAIYRLSRLPASFFWRRMRYPGFFLLMLAIILPLFSGETILLQLGPLTVRQEGLLHLLLIAVKFICILTLSMVLFGTARFLTTIKAMRYLGIPDALVDMTLFSYRYIFKIGDDLERMQTATTLRGFRPRSAGAMGTLASLAGSLLVRSYEQTDRVYRAMILRGYGEGVRAADDFTAGRADRVALIVTLALSAGFAAAEILLR